MKILITNFYNIRFFKPYMIPLSTTGGDPEWYHQGKNQDNTFVDKRGVINGLRASILSFPFQTEVLNESCQKNCPYKYKYPNCEFLSKYRKYLSTLDYDFIKKGFITIGNEIKRFLGFKEEPIIVLIVYEKVDNPCSERQVLVEVFREHGFEIEEWSI